MTTDGHVLLSCFLETSRNPLVKDACIHPGRYDELKSVLSLTEKIQKSLHEYLATKRQSFPRFYFISDDELLSIIGSSNSADIQGYLQKMFDNIAAVNFIQQENELSQEEEYERKIIYAIGMVSMEREEMKFVNPVECYGKVEVWM